VDVRVVAATNCHLERRIDEGRFREDLFYRINVVPILMPPLRHRRGDIPLLTRYFAEKVCQAEGIPLKTLSAQAVERLVAFPWPGNVRQLENMVEMAIALSGERLLLDACDFPLPSAHGVQRHSLQSAPVIAVPDGGLDYERTLAGIECSILEQALQKTGGNKKAAAQMLGLKRTTLCAKVRSLNPAGVWN
jgi:DNA-binding NtrC family response regulator